MNFTKNIFLFRELFSAECPYLSNAAAAPGVEQGTEGRMMREPGRFPKA